MTGTRKKNTANLDIRKLLVEKGIRHYEAATACGVTLYTFSHWLQVELPEEKKERILQAIEQL